VPEGCLLALFSITILYNTRNPYQYENDLYENYPDPPPCSGRRFSFCRYDERSRSDHFYQHQHQHAGPVTNNVASLTWVMEGETNAKYTVIERSGDDGSYDSIGVVIDIDDNNTNTYTFADNNMINGNNYYRLRMVDMAGDTRYSKIVSLYASLQTTAAATSSMTVYPNPAVATINYTIASTANQQVFVQVYNLSGVALMTTEQQLTAGNNVESIAISSLKAGSYFLKITSVQGNMQYVQSFIKLM
jgi:hypothetical protein